MVARKFQSYTFKRSVNFVNAVDVVDTAEQPRRGTRRSEAKQIHCRGGFRVVVIQWKLSKMPPPPGRRVAAPENPLRWRISLCHSVETYDQDVCRRLEGGEQGVPERPNLLRRRSLLRYSERLRKNRSIREFRFLSYICICAKFFFPTGFFFLSSALPGIFVQYMFNFIGCLPNLLSLCCPCCPCGVQSHLLSYPMRLRCP
jgi:hypothetical protein